MIDEAFADSAQFREQSLRPALLTRADGQLVVTSTAGTVVADYWMGKVRLGRDLVDRDVTEGICYFEWSAERRR